MRMLVEAHKRRSSAVALMKLGVESVGEVEGVGSGLGRIRRGEGGGAGAVGDFQRGEVGGDGSCAGGGDDGWLGMVEEPLDGFPVGLVAQLPGELENAGCADGGHADPTTTAVNFDMSVFV